MNFRLLLVELTATGNRPCARGAGERAGLDRAKAAPGPVDRRLRTWSACRAWPGADNSRQRQQEIGSMQTKRGARRRAPLPIASKKDVRNRSVTSPDSPT